MIRSYIKTILILISVTTLALSVFSGCTEKKPAAPDDKNQENPKKSSAKKKLDVVQKKLPPKKRYSGPDADLKERLEKAFFEFRCVSKTATTAELSKKQDAIYKKYGFKSALAYSNGILKLQEDDTYFKQLHKRAKNKCNR